MWDRDFEHLLRCLVAEFTEAGGPAIDAAVLREHVLAYVAIMGTTWLLDVPGFLLKALPEKVGDRFEVKVPPAKGYGERDPERVQAVPRSAFPHDAPLSIGAQLHAEVEDGNPLDMTVLALGDKEVTLDFNHPLAGSTLDFDIAVTAIREATSEELEHGHVHGPDGHDHGGHGPPPAKRAGPGVTRPGRPGPTR